MIALLATVSLAHPSAPACVFAGVIALGAVKLLRPVATGFVAELAASRARHLRLVRSREVAGTGVIYPSHR